MTLTEILEPHDFETLAWQEWHTSDDDRPSSASDWDEQIVPEIASGLEDDYREVWEG